MRFTIAIYIAQLPQLIGRILGQPNENLRMHFRVVTIELLPNRFNRFGMESSVGLRLILVFGEKLNIDFIFLIIIIQLTLSLLEFPAPREFVEPDSVAPDAAAWPAVPAFDAVGALALEVAPGTVADDEDEFFFDLDEDVEVDDVERDDLLLVCFLA